MKIRDLVKEGWLDVLTEADLDNDINQEEIDELVFRTWGWALKSNAKKLKENDKLAARVKETNFDEVMERIEEKNKSN